MQRFLQQIYVTQRYFPIPGSARPVAARFVTLAGVI
jgi:hypothetical protein